MEITLSPEAGSMLQRCLDSGQYKDMDEILRKALQLLLDWDAGPRWDIETLRKELEIGRDDLRNGRFSERTVDEIAEDVLRAYRSRNNELEAGSEE